MYLFYDATKTHTVIKINQFIKAMSNLFHLMEENYHYNTDINSILIKCSSQAASLLSTYAISLSANLKQFTFIFLCSASATRRIKGQLVTIH